MSHTVSASHRPQAPSPLCQYLARRSESSATPAAVTTLAAPSSTPHDHFVQASRTLPATTAAIPRTIAIENCRFPITKPPAQGGPSQISPRVDHPSYAPKEHNKQPHSKSVTATGRNLPAGGRRTSWKYLSTRSLASGRASASGVRHRPARNTGQRSRTGTANLTAVAIVLETRMLLVAMGSVLPLMHITMEWNTSMRVDWGNGTVASARVNSSH